MTIKLKIICIRKVVHFIKWSLQSIFAMAIVTYQNWAHHFWNDLVDCVDGFVSCVDGGCVDGALDWGPLLYSKKCGRHRNLFFISCAACSFGSKQELVIIKQIVN